jgi:hypothetical protein
VSLPSSLHGSESGYLILLIFLVRLIITGPLNLAQKLLFNVQISYRSTCTSSTSYNPGTLVLLHGFSPRLSTLDSPLLLLFIADSLEGGLITFQHLLVVVHFPRPQTHLAW